MGVLPANCCFCLPLIGIVVGAILQNMLSCDSSSYIRMQWDNFIGLIALLIAILLLILKENASFVLETDSDYGKQYIANLIIFVLGCLLLTLSDIYKRVALAKVKISLLEHNLIQPLLT